MRSERKIRNSERKIRNYELGIMKRGGGCDED
jgi:hypothetical protein